MDDLGPGRRLAPRRVAAICVGLARAAEPLRAWRGVVRVRSQRDLALARHGRKRRSRRPRTLLERLRPDGRDAGVRARDESRARWLVHYRQRRHPNDHPRQAKRLGAARFAGWEIIDRAWLEAALA